MKNATLSMAETSETRAGATTTFFSDDANEKIRRTRWLTLTLNLTLLLTLRDGGVLRAGRHRRHAQSGARGGGGGTVRSDVHSFF